MQRHNVIITKDDGGVEIYPMKQWLRDNPQHLPPGVETTSSTSHQLRDMLRKQGWTMRERPHEILLVHPNSDVSALDKVAGAQSGDDTDQEADEIAFGLEYQLRDFIAANIGAINVNGKRLSLFVDPAGRDGIEFPTEVGLIDILAIDKDGTFFVFELKRASSPDRAIGQLARYMGWVKQTIGKNRNVHGVIVAKTISDCLKYAASIFPNVHLFEYSVEFHLKLAQLRAQ